MDNDATTRARLLEAAIELFAEHGYDRTTVRDIARRAEANQAAVNYHFRSKEGIYREAFVATFQRMVMPDDEVPSTPDVDPDDGIAEFVAAMTLTDKPKNEREVHMRLVSWEMRAPTGVILDTVDRTFAPHLEMARRVVRPFLPPDAPRSAEITATLWLIGQCMHGGHRPPPVEALLGPAPDSADDKAATADLLTRLALHGLHGLRTDSDGESQPTG